MTAQRARERPLWPWKIILQPAEFPQQLPTMYLCAMRTLRGLGWPPIHRPFISSIAVAASDVLENLMYVTPEKYAPIMHYSQPLNVGHVLNISIYKIVISYFKKLTYITSTKPVHVH